MYIYRDTDTYTDTDTDTRIRERETERGNLFNVVAGYALPKKGKMAGTPSRKTLLDPAFRAVAAENKPCACV